MWSITHLITFVCGKTAMVAKSFATSVANKRFFTRVNAHMCGKTAIGTKYFAVYFIGTLFVVFTFVCSKAAIFKHFSTSVTHTPLVSQVNTFMCSKSALMAKCFATHITNKWLLSRMNTFM